MNIRATGISLIIGALFAIPAATATASSSLTGTAAQQRDASYLVLAEAPQQADQIRERKGQGQGQGDSGHGGHGQGDQSKQNEGKSGHGGGDSHSGGHGDHGKGDKDHHHHHGHNHSYAHSIAKQADALGLSDEQLGKVVRMHLKEDKQAHERIKQKMMESMKAFRKAVGEPATDDETLRKLGQAHVDSFNEMVKYHLDERKAVDSILTPEQIGKLKDIKSGHDHHNH
ncbi:MAG: Spy/CpxP family protein refolding chaperone [Burkholderiales bacterium]|nr:Spy/CpxP family protein refolding chaperone [Burkholderiales bacterium]